MGEVYFIISLMVCALITVIVGVVFMALGNKVNKKYQTTLMGLRVVIQAAIILIIAFSYYYNMF